MDIKDRFKLSSAMGWKTEQVPIGDGHRTKWHKPDGTWTYAGFSPTTDANDDYAVLEWMRDHGFSDRLPFCKAVADELQQIDPPLEGEEHMKVAWPDAAMRYLVGDYARAALTVLQRRGTT